MTAAGAAEVEALHFHTEEYYFFVEHVVGRWRAVVSADYAVGLLDWAVEVEVVAEGHCLFSKA